MFFFKQKTAYEIGTGDWSSDVCSSDLMWEISHSVSHDFPKKQNKHHRLSRKII